MPMDRSKYPDNWDEISYYIRFRSNIGAMPPLHVADARLRQDS